jgi:AcrR family transcriptional regulator
VKTRKRIVGAFFDLVAEGNYAPTGEAVAVRAGVGHRTVFRHFQDMESLYAEVDEMLERQVRPLMAGPALEGVLDARVAKLLERRAAVFERVTPFLRAQQLRQWESTFLRESHARFVKEQRATLMRDVPELASAPPPVRHALELVTSFSAWERLRRHQGLSVPQAQEAVRAAVLALLRVPPRGRAPSGTK